MSKYQTALVSLLIFLLLNLLAMRSISAPRETQLTINGADAALTKSNSASPNLNTILQNAQPRIVVEYSNAMNIHKLNAVPSALQTVLNVVPKKITLQYANSNRHLTLVYPRALLNDTVPPVIGPIAPSSNAGSATISWSTDEFTRYTLRYGTQSGNYTQAVEEPLFAKQHTVTLSDLVSGSTYYLQVTAFDLSGNQTVSPEFIIDLIQPTPEPTVVPTLPPPSTPTSNPVFLPLVNR